MKNTWRVEIENNLEARLLEVAPVTRRKVNGLTCWSLERDGRAYVIGIQYDKMAVFRGMRIIYEVYNAERRDYMDETLPLKKDDLKLGWLDTKKLASMSEDTNKLYEKNRYLHWRFSSSKDWMYVFNAEQIQYVCDQIMPKAIAKYWTIIK